MDSTSTRDTDLIGCLTEPSLQLSIRLRKPARQTADPSRVVLFVHGATLASYLWDVPRPGLSWLDHVSERGWFAGAIDIRGYGASSKPAALTGDPLDHPPYARASEAIQDIDSAVEYLRARTGAARVHLVGGSWGSITTSLYATTIGREKIERLVLYAPIFADRNPEWLEMIADPRQPSRPNPNLGAYRWVTEAASRKRWDDEIPVADKSLWRDEATFRALIDEALSLDPQGSARPEPAFRAPNGTLLDLFEAFNERPLWVPGDLEIPTLLIRGDADPTSTHDDASRLFEAIASPLKRYVVIGNGAHFVIAERNARQVFDEVQLFLDTPAHG